MHSVRGVAREQHAVYAGIEILRAAQAEGVGQLFENDRQRAAVRAAAGVAADLLVVIEHGEVDRVAVRVQQAAQAGVDGRQVVQPGRGEQVLLKADELRRLVAVGAQFKGQNVLRRCTEALGQLAHEIALLLPCVLHRAAQRQHVDVRLRGNALVHLAVEVDGDVRDDGQRLVPCDKAARRAHGVVRPDEGHTGKAERAVEPGVQDRAAVGLHAQAAAAAGNELRLRLDAHAGPVRMRGGDAEHIARADGDGGEERAAAHKIAAAALHGKRRAQLQRGEALRGEGLLRHGDGMPRRTPAVQPVHQLGAEFRHVRHG